MSYPRPNHILLDLICLHIVLRGGKSILSIATAPHEHRVLRFVHGEANVTRQPDLAPDMDPDREYHQNAHMEFARLRGCYPSREGVHPVDQAFPGGAEDLEKYGFVLGDEKEFARQPQSLFVNEQLDARKAANKLRKLNEKRAKAGLPPLDALEDGTAAREPSAAEKHAAADAAAAALLALAANAAASGNAAVGADTTQIVKVGEESAAAPALGDEGAAGQAEPKVEPKVEKTNGAPKEPKAAKAK